MPGVVSNSDDLSLITYSPNQNKSHIIPIHHSLKPPISRLSIAWARGNSLRVSVFQPPQSDDEPGGEVVEVKLGVDEADIYESQWRRIAYGSVTPFAVLQSRKNSITNAYNADL